MYPVRTPGTPSPAGGAGDEEWLTVPAPVTGYDAPSTLPMRTDDREGGERWTRCTPTV
jgi:hypothetical protein